MHFFVTGTDTEIGKTLVSSALLHCFVQRGWKSVGMKPVAAGAFLQNDVWCNEDVLMLKAASNVTVPAQLVNPYLFKLPAAPHIAAEVENQTISLPNILESYQKLKKHADVVVVEGVGGFCVPLNTQEDSADLAQQLNLPVILVVGMRLGCINHALLTAEAIGARGLILAGWVANSAQPEMAYLEENIQALQARLSAPLIGRIPYLEKPTVEAAAKYIELMELERRVGKLFCPP
jgi:dethiobiotin synthetase